MAEIFRPLQRQRQEPKDARVAIASQSSVTTNFMVGLGATPHRQTHWVVPGRQRPSAAALSFVVPNVTLLMEPELYPAGGQWENPPVPRSRHAQRDAAQWTGWVPPPGPTPLRPTDLTPIPRAKSSHAAQDATRWMGWQPPAGERPPICQDLTPAPRRPSNHAVLDAARQIGFPLMWSIPHRPTDLTPRFARPDRYGALLALSRGYPRVLPIPPTPLNDPCFEPAAATMSDQLVVLSNMQNRMIVVQAILC